MPCEFLAALTLIAQSMAHVPATDNGPITPSAAPTASTASMSTAEAAQATTHPGFVVSAPHDGFDLGSGLIAQRMSRDLGWGLVLAQEYRKTSARRWFDVNRPTERRWVSGAGFAEQRSYTPRARDIYDAYQRRVLMAAEVSQAPIDMLVEVHTHERRVAIGGVRVPLMVIEMASNGFSAAELRALKTRYQDLVSTLPAAARVPLAIDDIDRRYIYRGEVISYFFRATGARNEGSMRRSMSRRSLHLELPPIVVAVPELRTIYSRILASMVRPMTSSSGTGSVVGALSGN